MAFEAVLAAWRRSLRRVARAFSELMRQRSPARAMRSRMRVLRTQFPDAPDHWLQMIAQRAPELPADAGSGIEGRLEAARQRERRPARTVRQVADAEAGDIHALPDVAEDIHDVSARTRKVPEDAPARASRRAEESAPMRWRSRRLVVLPDGRTAATPMPRAREESRSDETPQATAGSPAVRAEPFSARPRQRRAAISMSKRGDAQVKADAATRCEPGPFRRPPVVAPDAAWPPPRIAASVEAFSFADAEASSAGTAGADCIDPQRGSVSPTWAAPDMREAAVAIRSPSPGWLGYAEPVRAGSGEGAIAPCLMASPWPVLPPPDDAIPVVATHASPFSRLSRLRHEQEIGLWNG